MSKRLLYIVIFLIFGKRAFTQTSSAWQTVTKEEIIASYKNVWDWFVQTQNYSFQLKYTSYKDHVSGEVIESSEGSYKRSGLKYKTEAVGIKTIQNEKVKIVVDTADKMIALTNPSNLSPTMQSTDELKKLLENVRALKKKSIGKSIVYRIDFTKNELYEAYEFVVSEKGLVDRLVYYYSEQTEKDYGDGENEKAIEFKMKPRLEIAFTNYVIQGKITETEFTDKSIVLADNRKVILLDKYKAFQVKDYRLQK